MTNRDDVWKWFEDPMVHEPETSQDEMMVRKAFARLLTYPEAKPILDHLHKVTRNRVLGPDVSEATLRYMEGQKAVVAYIERMAWRGRRPDTRKNSPPSEGQGIL